MGNQSTGLGKERVNKVLLVLVVVQIVLPLILYECSIHIMMSRHVTIQFERYWDSSRALEALRYVESGRLHDRLPSNISVLLFNNDTVRRYLRYIDERRDNQDFNYRLTYRAMANETPMKLDIVSTGNMTNVSITINNKRVLWKRHSPPVSIFYNNSSAIIRPQENISRAFYGFYIHMQLLFSETCKVPALCGWGFSWTQYILLDSKFNVVLIIVEYWRFVV